MELFKSFFYKILGPMIWLIPFAYAFTFSTIHLVKAWKAKNTFLIGLNFWVFLVGLYFLIYGKIY
jgi:hypothetical protein